jgi:deazaflavin-dependent oxidoreductase (nitroreductase family)
MSGAAHGPKADPAAPPTSPAQPAAHGNRLIAALDGLIAPVDYSRRIAYRRPPALYRRLQWLGWLLTSHGWVPDFVVMLEVPGRRSGKLRRTLLVRTVHGGREYLVALAGESEWVRNVRAAAGRVVIRRGEARRVTLVEVPCAERPAIIREYLCGSGRRADSREAQRYFGVGRDASLEVIGSIVERYPVFEITAAGAGPAWRS